MLASVGLLTLYSLLDFHPLDSERLLLFGVGGIFGLVLVCSFRLQRLRVGIHELKHWAVVKLTGNKVHDFHVGADRGHVEYAMYRDRLHFAPIITLAPYFFPLFSLPWFIACIALEGIYPMYHLSLVLGLALATDVALAMGELHPHQTDFSSVRGGFFTCALYLAGVHSLWVTMCVLWVIGGRFAFIHGGYIVMQLVERIAAL